MAAIRAGDGEGPWIFAPPVPFKLVFILSSLFLLTSVVSVQIVLSMLGGPDLLADSPDHVTAAVTSLIPSADTKAVYPKMA